ncbi:HEXXH motif domain-containing protein, partial [Streptomyces sp. NPDC002920]
MRQTSPAHVLPARSFEELLGGGGDTTTVDALCASERSWRLLVVRALLDAAGTAPDGPLPPPADAWRLLVRAGAADPAAAERVLAYPATGVWAAHTLRRLRGSTEDDAPSWVHTGHLHALAASAAIAAGLDFRTTVPVRYGWAVLPGIGAMKVEGATEGGAAEGGTLTGDTLEGGAPGRAAVDDGASGWAAVEDGAPDWAAVEVCGDGDGRLTVAGRAVPGPGWHGLTRLDADGCALLLDDLDPYRTLRTPSVPEPLGSADDRDWRELFAGAWQVLREAGAEEAGAEEARALARGLAVVVPRPRAERYRPHSASSGDAFGAALASLPDDAEQFAATLVHEFQHNKLSAFMHLFTLYEGGGDRLHYAPWRDDPRPLGGLLQGVYAFHGVAGFWRQRQHPLGRFEFALWRSQTAHALRSIADAEQLTHLGRRLVSELSARLRPWLAEPVDPRCLAAAELATADHRATWRAYHLRPDPRTVRAHAEALAQGTPPPDGTPAPALVPGRPTRGLDTRAGHRRPRQSAACTAHSADSRPGARRPHDVEPAARVVADDA